jgi:predicted transcriptional regulator
MSSNSHADCIVELLAQSPGLDDDEIANRLGIEPRQTVNQICRRLSSRGVLVRTRGHKGKIVG